MNIKPMVWNRDRLAADAARSVAEFKESRITEPGRYYVDAFVHNYQRVKHVLDVTEDLLQAGGKISSLLRDGYYDVIRYLTAPPISEDDLSVLAGLSTKHAPSKLALPDNTAKVLGFVRQTLDAQRFCWVAEGRHATEQERREALVSTAALLSTQQVQTGRRALAKRVQEGELRQYLVDELGYEEVGRRRITTVFDAPKALEFCGETPVAGKKADMVIGLGDNRFMCVECKVSNSTVNSYKRLNHETVEKTTHWYQSFGTNGVVCAGLLKGVFSVENLVAAQDDGVSIFWSHDLASLGEFVRSTFPIAIDIQ